MFTAKWAFFRNILILGKENIPYNKPVLIASNHPSSFMDPSFVGLSLRQQIYFLARGDVFKNPFARWALVSLNILPIYRKVDSENNHEKNKLTYDLCADLLAKNKFIVIYPEGYCVQEKKLRTLKKGTSRLAFHALEKFNWDMDLYILPTGVNYSNPNKFQSDLVIHYGKPIRVQDYKQAYLKDKNKANYDLTRFLEEKMRKLLVIIDNRDLESFAEQIEIIYGKELAYRYNFNLKEKKEVYQMRRAIGSALNKANTSATEALVDLYADTKKYFNDIKKENLRDFLLTDGLIKKSVFNKTVLAVLCGIFLFPILRYTRFPFTYPHKIAKRATKVIEFYPSVLIGSGALLFTLYFLITALLLGFFLPVYWLFPLIIVFLITSAFLAVPYYRFVQKLKGAYRFNKLLKYKQQKLADLYEQRLSVIRQLDVFFDTWGFEFPNLKND